MSSILSTFLVLGVSVMSATAQESSLSLDEKPTPLEATPFTFPDFDEFNSENGLHVYVVENHDVPAVTFSLTIRGGDSYDPVNKDGATSMMGDAMSKGTKNRTAHQIAETLDGVGAGINVSVTGQTITVSGSALKKHLRLMVSILGEMLTEPTFKDEEIEKLRSQYLASVASQRGDAMETAHALSRKVIYGFDNPVSRRASEESIAAITRDDIVGIFRSFVIPNNASLAVVGDITRSEVEQLLEEHLANWISKDSPIIELPEMTPEAAGVYFIPREGSVQSSVIVCAAAPGFNSDEWLPINVASSYFGSSFGSILFQTLRETHSYTYSPFGYTTRGGKFNRIALGAEVRSSVTDSALNVILHELKSLVQNGPDDTKLSNRIALLAGQYALTMERPSNVASLLQNGWVVGSTNEAVAGYADRLKSVSWGDVKNGASRYLSSNNLRIVVVGSPEVREKLESFGVIHDYDMDLKPASASAYEDAGMDVEDVLEAHVEALGGEEAVEGVTSIAYTGNVKMSMQGQSLDGEAEKKVMTPNKEYSSIKLPVMQQQQWFNGTDGWIALNGAKAGPMKPEEVEEQKYSPGVFPAMAIMADGWESTVLGKKNSEIHVSAVSPAGKKSLFVFAESTMLLNRIEKTEDGPQGPMLNTTLFADYSIVSGVNVPRTVQMKNTMYTIDFSWTVAVNSGVAESDFSPSN